MSRRTEFFVEIPEMPPTVYNLDDPAAAQEAARWFEERLRDRLGVSANSIVGPAELSLDFTGPAPLNHDAASRLASVVTQVVTKLAITDVLELEQGVSPQVSGVHWRYLPRPDRTVGIRVAFNEAASSHVLVVFSWDDGSGWFTSTIVRVRESQDWRLPDAQRRLLSKGYPFAGVTSRALLPRDERDFDDLIEHLEANAPGTAAVPFYKAASHDDISLVVQTAAHLYETTYLREALAELPAIFGFDRLRQVIGMPGLDLDQYLALEAPISDAAKPRLYFVAGVVAMLKSSYNELAVRRWFERSRSRFGGRSPFQMLEGDWDPSGPQATAVLELAQKSLI